MAEHLGGKQLATGVGRRGLTVYVVTVAGLPLALFRAWSGRLVAGQTVLILGSTGVSLFALQFAKVLGARVIATTSSAHKEERLRELGADEVVNYATTPDWHLAVRELTDDRGVDRVVDVAGDVSRSLKSVAMNGHVALVGFVSGNRPPIDPTLSVRGCRHRPGGVCRQPLPVRGHEPRHRPTPVAAGHRPCLQLRGRSRRLPLLRVGHGVREGRHLRGLGRRCTLFGRFAAVDCVKPGCSSVGADLILSQDSGGCLYRPDGLAG